MHHILKNKSWLNIILLVLLMIAMIANQVLMGDLNKQLGVSSGNFLSGLTSKLAIWGGGGAALTGNISEDSIKLAFFQGQPAVYGQELSVNFDDVENSMNTMKRFDPTYGANKIILEGDLLKRYISVSLLISCEFCCGAKSIITENGDAACGCAHSQAMRGLSAYLIQKHGGEYTDDQILRELARWKGRYFPKQMIQKTAEQLQSGTYTPDVASLVLDVKLPKYNGKNQNAPLPSEIKDLPGMVGGC